MPPYQATIYAPEEERFNIISHVVGFVLAIIGTVLLLIKTSTSQNTLLTTSALVYGISMIILYAASSLYHSAKKPKLRHRFNILDHAAIYVLIAGTYTPFTLVTLNGKTGWILFCTVWAFALVGIVLKLFFTGRFDRLSTLMYIFMGWMVVFAIRPLIANLATEGLIWMFAGGLAYTIGAVLYGMPQRVEYNHAIFHVFVLIGSFCHYMAVYFWVA